MDTLIQTIRKYIRDIEMEFGIEKCAMLIMKNRKELPNQESIRKFGDKENYKYLEILKSDTIKRVEMKRVSQMNEKADRNEVL